MAAKPLATFADIRRRIPGYAFDTIVDVGANVGQSALAFAAAAPEARIYAFEPTESTFAQLAQAVAAQPAIVPVRALLSNRTATVRFKLARLSLMNRIVGADEANSVEMTAQRGADLLRRLGIAGISYLKIDTEGHELEVLEGFDFAATPTDFIQTEVGMNDYNRYHVPFGEMAKTLRDKGFHLFRLYNQVQEWQDGGRPLLRRADVLFIHDRLVGDLGRLGDA